MLGWNVRLTLEPIKISWGPEFGVWIKLINMFTCKLGIVGRYSIRLMICIIIAAYELDAAPIFRWHSYSKIKNKTQEQKKNIKKI